MERPAEKPLISVIVPVYQVEAYLRECVDSICRQTYENLEIILVDDGSPDGCPAICDSYAQRDLRVQVIHQRNQGLSAARNAGLDRCTGRYFLFVDSDDWLPPDAVEHLHRVAAELRADLTIGGHCRVTGAEEPEPPPEEERVELIGAEEAVRRFLAGGCAAWARLYRRELHGEIRFPVGEINEDEAVVLQVLGRCGRVAVSRRRVYCYRLRQNSITTGAFTPRKLVWVRHCYDNLAVVRAHYPELIPCAESRYFSSISWALYKMAPHREYQPLMQTLCAVLRQHHRQIISSAVMDPKTKLRLLLQGYCWRLFRFHAARRADRL